MNLITLFSLLSLAFLSAQSLSAPSPAPTSSEAPIDAVCDVYKEYINEKAYEYCIAIFDSYPTIRNASSKGVAIIANNVAQKRLGTLVTRLKTYLSTSSPSESMQKNLGKCINFLGSEGHLYLQNTMHLIREERYRLAMDQSEKFYDEFFSACIFKEMSHQIKFPSYQEFLLADGATQVALAIMTGQLQLLIKH